MSTFRLPEEMARQCALDTAEIADLGAGCLDELRALLAAIVELSRDHVVIHDLAKVAVGIANENYDLVSRYQMTAKEKLAALRTFGGTHA